MDSHEITVDGVTYRRGERLKAIPLTQGSVFFDLNCLHKVDNGSFIAFSGGWSTSTYFPSTNVFYEAIVVEKQPEWREVKLDGYYRAINKGLTRDAERIIRESIAETLKASRIRIHNVDGSVSEFESKRLNGVTVWEFSTPAGGMTSRLAIEGMQADIQLAFMRGSKVEVLG